MFWPRSLKVKVAIGSIAIYCIVYSLAVYSISVGINIPFINPEYQVRNRYKLIFLQSKSELSLSDSEGVAVFDNCKMSSRSCFITNNKGFVPMSHYDAMLWEPPEWNSTAVRQAKSFLLMANSQCISAKFANCESNPEIILSDASGLRQVFNFCTMCEFLHTIEDEY